MQFTERMILLKLKYTKFQKLLEFITIIILLLLWIYLIKSWGKLPGKIPGHYNASGIVDRWGNKNEILLMPIMCIVLYIILTILSFFPAVWNVPVEISEENREYVYLNIKTMLILLKMQVIIIFSCITYSQIKAKALGIWFLPLTLIILFGTIIYYIKKTNK